MKNLLKYAVLIMSVFAGYVLIMAIAEAQQRIREIRQLNDDRKAIDHRRDIAYNNEEDLKYEKKEIRLNGKNNMERMEKDSDFERIDALRKIENREERIYSSRDTSFERNSERKGENSERRLEKRKNIEVIKRNDITRREVTKNERMKDDSNMRAMNREYELSRVNRNLNIENLQDTRLKSESNRVKNIDERGDKIRILDERRIREMDVTRIHVNTNENDQLRKIQEMDNQRRNVNIHRSLNHRELNERNREELSESRERSREEEKNILISNRITKDEERIFSLDKDILTSQRFEDKRVENIQKVENEARSSRKDDYYSLLRKGKYLDDVSFVESKNKGNIYIEKISSYFYDSENAFNFKGLYLTNALGLIGIFYMQKRKYFDQKIVQTIRQYLF